MAACHPEDYHEQYWNHLHTYVCCTKVAQSHEGVLIKMMKDASNDVQEKAGASVTFIPDDPGASASVIDNGEGSNFDSTASEGSSESCSSIIFSDEASGSESDSDEHSLAPGSASELSSASNPSSPTNDNDKAAVSVSFAATNYRRVTKAMKEAIDTWAAISSRRLQEL
jgi:hypothetical protein